MHALIRISRLPVVAAVAAAVLSSVWSGCAGPTNSAYTTTYDPYGRPVQTDQYGRPVYPAQPGTAVAVDQYGQPIYNGTYSQPAYVPTVAAPGMGGYIYYPDSEVYYDPGQRIFVYRDHDRWIRNSAPPRYWDRNGISVRLSFNDSPWNHHHEVMRQYPHRWRPDRRYDGGWR
jgi:hypothetical protein